MLKVMLLSQLRRAALPYSLLALTYSLALSLIPWRFQLNLSSTVVLSGVYVGLCVGVCWWATPLEYYRHLPLRVGHIRLCRHLFSMALTAAPTLLVIACYASGLREIILKTFYGDSTFAPIKTFQLKNLGWLLLSQIAACQIIVTLFAQTSFRQPFERKTDASVTVAFSFGYCVGILLWYVFGYFAFGVWPAVIGLAWIALLAAIYYLCPFENEYSFDAWFFGGNVTAASAWRRPWYATLSAISLAGVQIILILLALRWFERLATNSPASAWLLFLYLVFAGYFAMFLFPVYRNERALGKNRLTAAALMFLVVTVFPSWAFLSVYRYASITPFAKEPPKPVERGVKTFGVTIIMFIVIWVIAFNFKEIAKFLNQQTIATIKNAPPVCVATFHGPESVARQKIEELKHSDAHPLFINVRDLRDDSALTAVEYISEKSARRLEEVFLVVKAASPDYARVIAMLPRDDLEGFLALAAAAERDRGDNLGVNVGTIRFTALAFTEIFRAAIAAWINALSPAEADREARNLWAAGENGAVSPTDTVRIEMVEALFRKFPWTRRFWKEKLMTAHLDFLSRSNPFGERAARGIDDDDFFEWLVFMAITAPRSDNAYWKLLFRNARKADAVDRLYATRLAGGSDFYTQPDLLVDYLTNRRGKIPSAIYDALTRRMDYDNFTVLLRSGRKDVLDLFEKMVSQNRRIGNNDFYVIADCYAPADALAFLRTLDGREYGDMKALALCRVQSPEIATILEREVIDNPGCRGNVPWDAPATQNAYLFPFLKQAFTMGEDWRNAITQKLCVYDGPLTEKWVDWVRANGSEKDKKLLEDCLRANDSCYAERANGGGDRADRSYPTDPTRKRFL